MEVVAASDCEVVSVEGIVAAEVTGRHPDLASALNRLAATRRRQLERLRDSGSGDGLGDGGGNGRRPAVPGDVAGHDIT